MRVPYTFFVNRERAILFSRETWFKLLFIRDSLFSVYVSFYVLVNIIFDLSVTRERNGKLNVMRELSRFAWIAFWWSYSSMVSAYSPVFVFCIACGFQRISVRSLNTADVYLMHLLSLVLSVTIMYYLSFQPTLLTCFFFFFFFFFFSIRHLADMRRRREPLWFENKILATVRLFSLQCILYVWQLLQRGIHRANNYVIRVSHVKYIGVKIKKTRGGKFGA